MARAPKGGTTGINGESYDGGQFLPNTALPKMSPAEKRRARAATQKVEIEPYVWAVPPSPEHRSILRRIGGIYGRVERNGVMVLSISPITLAYYKDVQEDIEALAEKYNQGERWYTK